MKMTKLPLVLAIASTAAYAEVSLYDYSQATSAYEDAYFTAKFNIEDGNQDQESYNLDLSVDYQRVLSSADNNTKLLAKGFTNNSRGGAANDKSTSNYQGTASVTHDMYFNPQASKNFWYGEGSLGVRKGMEDPYADATVGIGHGRVVNATPMAKANRLVAALLERGLLKGKPSASAYQRVAKIIDKESAYRSKFGGADYKQNWIQDIENALGTDLDARGVIKAYDVLEYERISTRKYGWLVRAGVGTVISNYNGEDGGDPLVKLQGEYHLPITNNTQFSNIGGVSTVWGDNNSYNYKNDMTLTHEISDRIDWENKWAFQYTDNENGNDIMSNSLSSTFRYYVSNALNLDVTARVSKFDDDVKYSVNGVRNDDTDTSLRVGFNYRLK